MLGLKKPVRAVSVSERAERSIPERRAMNELRLPGDLAQALADGDGFVRGDGFVLMSLDVFQDRMGDESAEEFEATVAALREGLADIAAGRTVSMEEAWKELDEKYGV